MCVVQFHLHFIIRSIRKALNSHYWKLLSYHLTRRTGNRNLNYAGERKGENLKNNDSENRESGEVRTDERRLEFEGIIRHIIRFTRFLLVNCSSSRNALGNSGRRKRGKKKRRRGKGTDIVRKECEEYELNEHGLISEAEFTSGVYDYCSYF